MIRTLLLSTLSINLTTALAADIRGVVLDPSARPVPNATVTCGALQTATGPDGGFVLNSDTACDATVNREGFEQAALRLSPGEEHRVRLEISKRSDRVVVSATRTPTTIEESGVSATVFTAADLEERQLPVLPDLLRDAPGVTVMTGGRRGAITSIFTRGSQSTGTLVLLDGVPLNEPGGQVNLANFSTAGLDRIEVVRGAQSALFGAEAAAGVVQLFTATGDPESRIPRGSVAYERGNFKTDRWIANLNGGLGRRLDYSLTADQFHTVGMFGNDYYRNTTGTANLGFRVTDRTQIRAVFREYDAVVGNPGEVAYGVFDSDAFGGDRGASLTVRVEDVRGANFVQRGSFNYNRLRNLYQNRIADGPFMAAALVRPVNDPTPRVYMVRQVPASFNPADAPAGTSLRTQTIFDWTSEFAGVFDRKAADYQGTVTHRGGALVFGYRYERQGGLISAANVDRTNNGGFFHEQFSIGRRLFVTGGARLEHSTTFGRRFVPRGSVTVQLFGGHGAFSSTFLRASAGRGFTEPSLLQNFAREPFYVGNPALEPERTAMADIGIVQEMFGRRVRAEVTYFRNAFRDLIVFDSSKFPSTWANIDRSRARGVETSITVRPARHVQVTGNFTRLNTRILETNTTSSLSGVGQELPRRPRNSGSAWISISPRRWNLMVGGRAIGERQDADWIFGVTRNPGFGTMFLNASYNLSRHVTPYIRFDNLLNERYQEVLGFTALTRSAIGGVRVAW